MRVFNIVILAQLLSFANDSLAANLTWSEREPVPVNGFQNPFNLAPQELKSSVHRGRLHALNYPVEVTGLLIPYEPVNYFFENTEESDPLKKFFRQLGLSFTKMESLDDLMAWLGLHHYPLRSSNDPVYGIPFPGHQRPTYRMGFSLRETKQGTGFTISCAVCHSANLFGKKVLGLTNRFPRANDFFVKGKLAVTMAPSSVFQWLTNATEGEKKMFRQTKENILSVQAKKPIHLGLDTSLAHVALSLAHRRDDAYATKDYWSYTEPRDEPLAWMPSESKPGVWWTVKYKNKWLLDGSVVSGNPILTNLLWNEIGRGSDLRELESWFIERKDVIQDLTNAVYQNQAPLFSDFFDAEKHFNLTELKKGQQLYNKMCAKCHGQHLKKWDLPESETLTFIDQIKTFEVDMPIDTKVVDVGTDSYRFRAMKSLYSLNQLAISQNNGIRIHLQKGYVPPPLEGIWARWPYFHNNSAPTLCSVLTPSESRPRSYWAGESMDKSRDFDSDCNGYPLGEKAPKHWKVDDIYFFNSRKRGLSNRGHDERIFVKEGNDQLSQSDRRALVRFLQTL